MKKKFKREIKYDKKFIKYSPIGYYFSNSFLKDNPNFIKEFNKFLPKCNKNKITLSDDEKKLLYNIANNIKELINNSIVSNL